MPTARKAAPAGPTTKKVSGSATGQARAKKATSGATVEESPAKKTAPAKKATAAKQTAPASKAPAKKSSPAKKAAAASAEETPAKAPVKSSGKVAAKPVEPAPEPAAPELAKVATKPSEFPVRSGEDRWTSSELAEVRADLAEDIAKHRRAIEHAEAELRALLADGAAGAGRDAADIGSANFERDQEMSLAASAREMLDQSERALRLIDQGLYGRCESCGEAIGKGRLQVYPRATMCVTCKQRHERR